VFAGVCGRLQANARKRRVILARGGCANANAGARQERADEGAGAGAGEGQWEGGQRRLGRTRGKESEVRGKKKSGGGGRRKKEREEREGGKAGKGSWKRRGTSHAGS
jgi:hypothetical protein